MSRRIERINVLLRQKLSEIISQEMKDPRLSLITTITHVGISHDLKHARVYASVLGSTEEARSAVEALNAASGFLQRELHARLSMKSVPRLSFVSDDSLERGLRMLERIDEVRSQDTPEETP